MLKTQNKLFKKDNEIILPENEKNFIKNQMCDKFYAHWCMLCLDAVQEVTGETDFRKSLELCYTRNKLFKIDPKDNKILLHIRSRDKAYMQKALFHNLGLVKGRYDLRHENPEFFDKLLNSFKVKEEEQEQHNENFIKKYIIKKEVNFFLDLLNLIKTETCQSSLKKRLEMISSRETLLEIRKKYSIRNDLLNLILERKVEYNMLEQVLFSNVSILLKNINNLVKIEKKSI